MLSGCLQRLKIPLSRPIVGCRTFSTGIISKTSYGRFLAVPIVLVISFYYQRNKVETSGRLEILDQNYCYSPIHWSSIIALIYPVVEGFYRSRWKLYLFYFSLFLVYYLQKIYWTMYYGDTYVCVCVNKKDNAKAYNAAKDSLDWDENIEMAQKIWFDNDEYFEWKDYYRNYFAQSVLHKINVESSVDSLSVPKEKNSIGYSALKENLIGSITDFMYDRLGVHDSNEKDKTEKRRSWMFSVANANDQLLLEQQDMFFDTSPMTTKFSHEENANAPTPKAKENSFPSNDVKYIRLVLVNTLRYSLSFVHKFQSLLLPLQSSNSSSLNTTSQAQSQSLTPSSPEYMGTYGKFLCTEYEGHDIIIVPLKPIPTEQSTAGSEIPKKGQPKSHLNIVFSIPKLSDLDKHVLRTISNESILSTLSTATTSPSHEVTAVANKSKKGNDHSNTLSKNDVCLKQAIHPFDILKLFEQYRIKALSAHKDNNQSKNVLYETECGVILPKFHMSKVQPMRDHFIVASGLKRILLFLYHEVILFFCLSYICTTASEISWNENGSECKISTIAYYDEGSRFWAGVRRWKSSTTSLSKFISHLGIGTVIKSYIPTSLFQSSKETVKNQNNDNTTIDHTNIISKLLDKNNKVFVFDRPFDFYICDANRDICYVAGSVNDFSCLT
ncbi:hypothetical protein RFI_13550 [Reticulomyxa filosa]|uniref:Uncharacterized protein n=1 Tax=Reticulomyxa filosa TaxID=46433 RepID=X6NC73_RETFI|nr:hypothetical protein RFI_13550 [Reticulomyxa filosa]|eukprot:ETO23631.1 hypothetical protein RFI_13550 [Reticulomyxa filosa]